MLYRLAMKLQTALSHEYKTEKILEILNREEKCLTMIHFAIHVSTGNIAFI